MNDQNMRGECQLRNRCKVPTKIVAQILIEARVSGKRRADCKHRVTIGRCARNEFSPQIARSTRAVVYNHLLAE